MINYDNENELVKALEIICDKITFRAYDHEQILSVINELTKIDLLALKYETREAALNVLSNAATYYSIRDTADWRNVISARDMLENDLKEYVDSFLSVEQLENIVWDDVPFDSYVVKTTSAARKKPLAELSNEEIRIMISQKVGLKYVIPIAMKILTQEPFIQTTFYEGDLLSCMLRLSLSDWNSNSDELLRFQSLVRKNIDEITTSGLISEDTARHILEWRLL